MRRLLLVVLLLAPGLARAEGGAAIWALGVDGGVALQSDQYILGPRLGLRARQVPFVELQLAALAGIGPDHFTARSSLRLRPRLDINGFRASLIAGLSLFSYFPRGPYATFCDKAKLDCSATVFG